jgi:hypothetical protein
MLRSARFALLVGLSATIPVVSALNPPKKQDQSKQQTEDEKKKAEAAKTPATDERLDRRDARMKERNREIDSLVNKKK